MRGEEVFYAFANGLAIKTDVFHKSDRMRFHDDYPARRVSVTMVFGNPPLG